MDIFISHKQEDACIAEHVCNTLNSLGVNAYLDLLEGDLLLEGEALTNHIKSKLNECTDILVVMSKHTQESWWVPFEIGMAAQRDFPIVSYLINDVELPDYLNYWPILRKTSDLLKYIDAKKKIIAEDYNIIKSFNSNHSSTKSSTKRFYEELKNKLKY